VSPYQFHISGSNDSLVISVRLKTTYRFHAAMLFQDLKKQNFIFFDEVLQFIILVLQLYQYHFHLTRKYLRLP